MEAGAFRIIGFSRRARKRPREVGSGKGEQAKSCGNSVCSSYPLLILMILYLQFRKVSTSLIVFSGVFVAWSVRAARRSMP